jgi:hypothetical protein
LAVIASLALSACSPEGFSAPTQPSVARVSYTISGTAGRASLTYTDESGNIQQQADVTLPTTLAFTVASGSFVVVSAQNQDDSGDIDCEIAANGATLNRGHSSGAYVIVSCSARVP